MPNLKATDPDHRAVALFERLSERPADPAFRARLLVRQDAAVIARLEALERAAARAAHALPTQLPGAVGQTSSPPPEQVGAFRLTELLGEGGMGQVWKGQRNDGLFDQVVAVKLLHGHLVHLAGDRFAEERRLLARLEHPGIARLIDGGVITAGAPYLVMEYVDGRPIDAAAEGLTERGKVELLLQAARAVQFAHEHLIVHADLKPSNLMVDGGGRVRLLDFGIARLVNETTRGVLSPMTQGFASPARMAGAEPIVADDVFALGVVLDGLIGETRDADLRSVIAKARAPDPADRYGSVADLIAELERWRGGFAVLAQPGGAAYRARKFVQRHRWGVMLSVAAVFALTTTSVVASLSYVRAERATKEARARFDDVRGAARYLLFELGDKLEQQPQSLALRTGVAAVSQAYLDRLANSAEGDAGVRAESAAGLLKLAERQAKPGRANLGQTKDAERNLARAYAIARQIPGPEGTSLAAQVRLDQTRLIVAVENDLATGERMLADARALIFTPAGSSPGLKAAWYGELSNLRQWQGRYAEAIAAARLGLAAPPPSDPLPAVLLTANLNDLLAEGLYYAGRPEDAIAPYQQRVTLLESASRRWPRDPQVARQLPRARWSLGSTLLDIKRPYLALPILQRGVAEARAVAAFDTADTDAARAAQITENAFAQALSATGRPAEAVGILAESVEARRKLWLEHPEEARRLRDYAVGLAMLGDAELSAGRVASACSHYDQVEAAFVGLGRLGRATALDADSTLKQARAQHDKHCAR